MTVVCTAFRCTPLPDGQVRLEIEQPQPGSTENPNDVLYVKDLAAILRVHPKTVEARSRRKKNPLLLVRGRGKPYCLRSSLLAYLASDPSSAAVLGTFA